MPTNAYTGDEFFFLGTFFQQKMELKKKGIRLTIFSFLRKAQVFLYYKIN
jgi:hypothetical protein